MGKWLSLLLLITVEMRGADWSRLTLSCNESNDLYQLLAAEGKVRRFADPLAAVQSAPSGSGVLILADNYPAERPMVSKEVFELANRKGLKLYLEYPSEVPGVNFKSTKTTLWERLIVSSDLMGANLPREQILVAHQCTYLPVEVTNALMVVAKVAGYNKAVYGIPAKAPPILFNANSNQLVATTKLSNFLTGRYAPQTEWQSVWNYILEWASGEKAALNWKPIVHPALESTQAVNEVDTFKAAVNWTRDSGLLVPESKWAFIVAKLKAGEEVSAKGGSQWEGGNGSHGILEGYASQILPDGHQRVRWPLRADCQAESAMLLALDSALGEDKTNGVIATNLLNFLYETSGMHGGVRGNPNHPAFGLIGWGAIAPAWEVATYGDDNARTMLATIVAAAALKTNAWDLALLKALFANLRTTGKNGFRGDRIDIPQLEKNGWKHYHDAGTVNYSPHFEAYSWACFLWAYQHTKYKPFLDKTKTAIRMTMEAYPNKWRWNDNMERAHMLLALCWLVRVEDTQQHREWVRTVAVGLMEMQDSTGALRERMLGSGGGHYQRPASNEAYGTAETPLMHEPNDPVSDQLYVAGFALLGLHEAALTLKDRKMGDSADKLAAYLCRIQNRSNKLPYLNGSWFRAFDFKRWEAWASSGDIGWGAWSIEAGWAQAWGAAVLALRHMNISLWDYTASTKVAAQLKEVETLMSKNAGEPWKN